MKLIILRGLPSSGKSTFADFIQETSYNAGFSSTVCTTDDYPPLYDRTKNPVQFNGATMDKDGVRMITKAHLWNQNRVKTLMQADEECDVIIVANTNTQRWEMEPYLKLAKDNHYSVTILEVQSGLSVEKLANRNANGTPENVIARMRDGFEHEWEEGNPNPPWER